MECEECGDQTTMSYECSFCGKSYCSKHRLPENHSCPGLSSYKKDMRKRGKLYQATDRKSKKKKESSFKISKVKEKFSQYYKRNLTFLFLGVIIIVYLIQSFILIFLGPDIHNKIFTLSTENPLYIWTWIISIFAHAPFPNFIHIFVNGIVLFFFGNVLERYIGGKKFFYLFILSGILSGVSQMTLGILTGETIRVLGASGAIMAVMGALTVLNPNLRVYLWFFIPVPLWIITLFYGIIDLTALSVAGPGAGGVARFAHLSGLAIGLLYGAKLKRSGLSVGSRMRLGRRRRGKFP